MVLVGTLVGALVIWLLIKLLKVALWLLFFAVLAYGAWDPAVRAWIDNEYEGEGVVDVPAWPARFAIVLGSIMTSRFYLLRIFGVETRLKIPARQEI